MPFMKTTGRKMATMATVAARAAKAISRVPSSAARDAALAALGVAEDVLEHHDGVVHDDADGERQAEQGEGVEREAQEVDDGERAEERHRDGEDDVEVEESEPRNSQQTSAVRSTARRSSNSISWTDSSMSAVVSKVMSSVDVLGQRLPDLRQPLAHLRGDRHGVGAALLADAEALGRHAVDAGEHPAVLEAVLDQRHVAEAEQRAVAARRTTSERKVVEVHRLAQDAHVDLAARALEPPGRAARGSGACSAADDVADRHALRVDARGVEPDAQVALAVAAEGDLADAGDGLEPLAHAVAGEVGELLAASAGPRRPPT